MNKSILRIIALLVWSLIIFTIPLFFVIGEWQIGTSRYLKGVVFLFSLAGPSALALLEMHIGALLWKKGGNTGDEIQ